MNLQNKISTIKEAKDAIKQALIDKGATPSGNITTYAEAISGITTVNNQSKTATQNGTVRPDTGYTGLSEVTVSVPLESLTINPSTTFQSITHNNHGGYNSITVNPVTSSIDSDIQANNIKLGCNILGVNGSVVELNGETKTVNPSTSQQVITPTSGKNGITQVTVNAVTSSIDQNLISSNIKSGVEILGITGNVVELNGQTKIVTPTTMQQAITPDSPKNGLTYVVVEAVTSAIDQNIVASNIKSGISILGIVGNYTGGTGSEGLNIEMLSNGTLGGDFFAIGGMDNDLWKMFDGDESTYYVNVNPFDFTFYSPIKLFLSAIKVISSGGFSIEEDVMIEGSIDNFNYSKLDYAGTLYEDGIISFLNPNPYKYYRFISFSSGKRNISEIQMMGTFVS